MSNSVCQSEASFILAAVLNGGKRFFASTERSYKLVKSKCRVGEVPNGILACKVVSHH